MARTWVIFLKYFCLWATISSLFLFLDLYTKPSLFNSLCSLIRPIWGKPAISWDSSYILVTVGISGGVLLYKSRQCPLVEIIKFDPPPPPGFVPIVFRIAFTYPQHRTFGSSANQTYCLR